jgi:hypothetical protein
MVAASAGLRHGELFVRRVETQHLASLWVCKVEPLAQRANYALIDFAAILRPIVIQPALHLKAGGRRILEMNVSMARVIY